MVGIYVSSGRRYLDNGLAFSSHIFCTASEIRYFRALPSPHLFVIWAEVNTT